MARCFTLESASRWRKRSSAGALENLEERIAPAFAGMYSGSAEDRTLTLDGTAGADVATFLLTANGSLRINNITPAGAAQTFSLTGVTAIVVEGLGGNDTITVDLLNGDVATASRSFSFFGGEDSGDTLKLNGTGAEDVLLLAETPGAGRMFVDGGTYYYANAPGGVALASLHSAVFRTSPGADTYTLSDHTLVSADGAQKFTFSATAAVTVDLGSTDPASAPANDSFTLASLSGITGLSSLLVQTGGGADTFTLGAGLTSFALPVAGAGVQFDCDSFGYAIVDLVAADQTVNASGTVVLASDGSSFSFTHPARLTFSAPLLTLHGSGVEAIVWQPATAMLDAGTLQVTGAQSLVATVTYAGKLELDHLASVTLRTAAGADSLALSGDGSAAILSATAQNSPPLVTMTQVASLTLDLGINDPALGAADTVVIASLNIPALQNLSISTGAGDDTLQIAAGITSLQLPVAGGHIVFDGGAGTDTISAAGDLSMTLSDSALEYIDSGGASAGSLGLSAVEKAQLTGGPSANHFVIPGARDRDRARAGRRRLLPAHRFRRERIVPGRRWKRHVRDRLHEPKLDCRRRRGRESRWWSGNGHAHRRGGCELHPHGYLAPARGAQESSSSDGEGDQSTRLDRGRHTRRRPERKPARCASVFRRGRSDRWRADG
jgi:hypothetical protein